MRSRDLESGPRLPPGCFVIGVGLQAVDTCRSKPLDLGPKKNTPRPGDISRVERNHSLRSGKMPFSPTIPFIVASV